MMRSIAAIAAIFAVCSLQPALAEVGPLSEQLGSQPAYRTVHRPGEPVRFTMRVDGNLVADGHTAAMLVIRGFDARGNPASTHASLDVSMSGGSGSLFALGAQPHATPTLMPSTTQPEPIASQRVTGTLGDDGILRVRFVPGLVAGEISITVVSDEAVSTQSFYAAPFARAPMVIGLGTVGAGPVPGLVDGDDIFDDSGARRGRLALFGTGTMFNTYVGTFAYESQNRLNPLYGYSAYTINPDERSYLTYGDASQRADDALSRRRFYARIDDSHNDSAMFGEFNASISPSYAAGGGASVLLSGAKLHAVNGVMNGQLTAFAADDNVAFGRLVVNPLGLGSSGPVLHPNLIVGSDIVTLIALDRRTGAILQETQLTRNVDYVVDYASGVVRFIKIPLPYDAFFNPQSILFQYEYDGLGSGAHTFGGRIEFGAGNSQTKVGIGYLNDANGASNFTIFSQDIFGYLPGGYWTASHSHNTGTGLFGAAGFANLSGMKTGGDAAQASFTTMVGKDRFSGFLDYTSSEYANPLGGLTTPGLTNMRLAWTGALGNKGGSITAEVDGQDNNGIGLGLGTPTAAYSQRNVGVDVSYPTSKTFTVLAGANLTHSSGFFGTATTPYLPYGGPLGAPYFDPTTIGPNPPVLPVLNQQLQVESFSSGTTPQGYLGFQWKASPSLELDAMHIADLSGNVNPTRPPGTTAQIAYNFFGKGRAFIRQLWNDAAPESFASSTSGLTAAGSAKSSTIFGLEREIGPNTTVESDYTVEQTANGHDSYASYGVREKVDLGKFTRGDAFFQLGNTLGVNLLNTLGQPVSANFTVYGLNLAYENPSKIRAAAGWQQRSGAFSGSSLTLGIAGHISPELAITSAFNDSNLAGFQYNDARLGLAWRPSGNMRGAGLLGYERYYSNFATLNDHTDVISYDQVYRATKRLELASKVAYKIDGDTFYAAHTTLFGVRATQTLGSRFDVGGEAHWTNVQNIPGVGQTEFAFEGGYNLGDSMRVAGGYNFSGSVDPALVGRPLRRGLYVTATSVIDRLFGWGDPRRLFSPNTTAQASPSPAPSASPIAADTAGTPASVGAAAGAGAK